MTVKLDGKQLRGFKVGLFLCVSAFACGLFAEHKDHNYVGSHGMAVLNSPEGGVFAHHLPLYSKPHDYQIIYKIGVPEAVKSLIAKNGLVTFLPENFDLSKLINGESFALPSTFFDGHFERGGEQSYKGDVEFLEPVYIRSLEGLESSSSIAVFDHVIVDGGGHLVVHRITPKPSLDAVAWLPPSSNMSGDNVQSNRATDCKSLSADPIRDSDIIHLLRSCFDVVPAYSEYADFQ